MSEITVLDSDTIENINEYLNDHGYKIFDQLFIDAMNNDVFLIPSTAIKLRGTFYSLDESDYDYPNAKYYLLLNSGQSICDVLLLDCEFSPIAISTEYNV